jgi:hypothetical protein
MDRLVLKAILIKTITGRKRMVRLKDVNMRVLMDQGWTGFSFLPVSWYVISCHSS